MPKVAERALRMLSEWYDSERPGAGREPERYVICAGLAVLEHSRTAFPLDQDDFITEGNQVKTSGSLIKSILKRHGETRNFASEGGRTTRGTRPAAERFVERLNALPGFGSLPESERGRLVDELQRWLADRAKEYFQRRKIDVEISLEKAAPQIIADILAAAAERRLGGPVAQHLVGAKLALRFPRVEVENHSFTTADQQTRRPGDFVIGDSAFHVTVSPTQAVIEKCARNLRDGYRVVVLVIESKVEAARQIAETLEIQPRVGVLSIENFVGQNLEELGEFGKANLAKGIRKLLETYNERVAAVEADRSLLIEIPENLQ